MKKNSLFLFYLISSLPFQVNATLQEALDSIKEEDYTFALKELNRLIDVEQNEEARYQLGRLYENGWGVEQDSDKALQLYKLSAENGNENSALKLGNAFYMGRGVEKNYADALKWYKISAQKGNYAAQYNIGLMLEEGTGVKKNIIKAFEYYKKSGEQGYGPAQYALGKMYLKGEGTPQNFNAAIRWHKLAADQGDFDAQMDLAKLFSNTSMRGLPYSMTGAHTYYNLVSAYATTQTLKDEASLRREEITKKMKPEEILEAQRRAQKWHKKSRSESIPALQGETFLDEDIPQKKSNSSKAEQEQIELTVKTDKETMLVAAGIGRKELNDAIKKNDFRPILTKLENTASSGNVIAQIALGDLYMLGQGLQSDESTALKWYTEASKKNNPIAFFKLAPIYCEGNVVDPDLAKCYMYVLLAKKYTDDNSAPFIDETLKMLDDSFDLEIRQTGEKLADEYNKIPENQQSQGLLAKIKSKFEKKDEIENDLVKETNKTSDSDDFFDF
ncbi:MAG: hypothetical protein MJ250_00600 [Alphaproteobacteria bacterium]|nr:hypothetical protein [Alphaproteobacteria bacterium]